MRGFERVAPWESAWFGAGGRMRPTANQALLGRMRAVESMVLNAFVSRASLFRSVSGDSRRDVYAEAGLPRGSIDPQFYQDLYDREAVAARAVEVLCKESWQVTPAVYDDEDPDTATEFEQDWDSVGSSLFGERSYHRGEKGSAVWSYLKRADILSGVGHYGILLLGFNDGLPLDQPAFGVDPESLLNHPVGPSPAYDARFVGTGYQQGSYGFVGETPNGQGTAPNGRGGSPAPPPPRSRPGERQLIYLRAFPEALAQITQFESRVNSPRFGQPTLYLVTFNDPREQQSGALGVPLASMNVHWTRVIHLADDGGSAGSSEVYAPPRCQPVLNNLLGLQKLYCGGPEMYWKGAFPGYSFETQPQLGADLDLEVEDKDALRDMMENYMNGLQRYMFLVGISAKSLAPQVVDPTPHILAQIEAICIKLGIPKRVFMGTERGELASTQDDDAWNDRLKERQEHYLSPRVVAPFVSRLVSLGVLRPPKNNQGFTVHWPDLTSRSEDERASVALKLTQCVSLYLSAGGDQLIPPMEFLTLVLGMDDEQARSVLQAASEIAQEEEAAREALAEEHGLLPDPPEGYQRPDPEPEPEPTPPPGPAPSVNAKDRLGHGSERRGRKGKASPAPAHSVSASVRAEVARDEQQRQRHNPQKSTTGPSKPEDRPVDEQGKTPAPKALEWKDPPPKRGKKGEGMPERPKGDESQTKIGDLGEELATPLGFRSILPEGQRGHKPGEVAEKGSTIDLEFDHSGRAYELKLCNDSATEYRLKAKKTEKEAKEKYAKDNSLTAYTLVAVREVEKGVVHFYAAKESGLTGAEVSKDKFDYLGSVSAGGSGGKT